MRNPLHTPETRLANFSKKYCKRKSLGDIPYPELEDWRKDTKATKGEHLVIHMSAKLWGDSAKSLLTAVSVINTMAPEFVESDESTLKLVVELQRSALRRVKGDYELKHGTFDEQLKRTKKEPPGGA